MLRKLLKYEFKSVFYLVIPLYCCFLAVSVAIRLFASVTFLQHFLRGFPFALLIMVYVGLFIGISVISLLLIIQRFYKGLLSEEGYLMFTLPAKPWQLIVSKWIVAVTILILGILMSILSICILAFDNETIRIIIANMDMESLRKLMELIPSWPMFIVEVILLVLVCLSKEIYHAYSAMSFGQLFGKNRIVSSVIAYGVEQIGFTALWVAAAATLEKLNFAPFENLKGVSAAHLTIWILILWQGIELAFYCVTTHWLLSKHLNLE